MSVEPRVLVSTKAWYKSRTVWVSVIGVALPILTYIGDNAFKLGLPDQAVPWIALGGFGLTTLALRFKTEQPVAAHDGDLKPLPGARLPDPPIFTEQERPLHG